MSVQYKYFSPEINNRKLLSHKAILKTSISSKIEDCHIGEISNEQNSQMLFSTLSSSSLLESFISSCVLLIFLSSVSENTIDQNCVRNKEFKREVKEFTVNC